MTKVYALILALLALLSAAMLVVPLRLIQPFRPQTESGVALAYQLVHWAPAVTGAALLVGVAALVAGWLRTPTWRWKAPALAAVLVLGVFAWAARVNVYQQNFKPLEDARFVPAAAAEMPNTSV